MEGIKKSVIILMFILMLGGVWAYPNLNGQRVSDLANILTDQEATDLTTQINSMEQVTGAQFAIVTVLNTEGQGRVDYAARTGEQNGVGFSGKDNGVVIMWSLDNEKGGAIATGRGVGDILTDVEVASIGRSHRAELDNGQYYIALSGILNDIQKQFPNNTTNSTEISLQNTSIDLPIGIIFLIIIGIIILIAFIGAIIDDGSSGGSGGFAGGYVGSSGGWSGGSSGGGFSGGSFGGGGGGF